MDFFSKFKMNIIPILKNALKIAGVIFTICTFVLSFISFEEIGINQLWVKILILIGFPTFSFLLSAILVLFVLRRNRIWKKGTNFVAASYGDLIDFSFSQKFKSNRIIVIPVNDTFDTIVEIGSEKTSRPLVSPTTLHGIWINKYCKQQNIVKNELNDRIQESLKIHGFNGENVEREKGNRIKYPLGSISIIDGDNNTIFYLLAISSFDERNNAHVTKKQLRDSIDNLLDFYDKNGQAIPLFVPLMGTRSSRAGLTHEQSLKIIKSSVLTSEEKINGSINIIVYNKDKNKVSIFK